MMVTVFAAAFLLAGSAPAEDVAGVSSGVDRLGTTASQWRDIDVLDRHRCAALPLVVSALQRLPLVPPGKVGGDLGRPDGWLTNRTNWLLIALRVMTDHDEYGPLTRREYARLPTYRERVGVGMLNRESLVRDLPAGRSRFYGYWPSHGTSYYGTARTQRAIRLRWGDFVRRFDCRKKLSERRWDASFFNG